MANRKLSMSIAGDLEDIRTDLATRKEANLDPILAHLIITRAIVHDGILEKPKYMAIHGRLIKSLKDIVDDSIMAVLLLTADDDGSAPPEIAQKWHTALSTHNSIDSALKELIFLVYGADVSRPFLRKKISLCRAAVIAFVNSQDFYDIIRKEASKENLQVKRHRIPERFRLSIIRKIIGL